MRPANLFFDDFFQLICESTMRMRARKRESQNLLFALQIIWIPIFAECVVISAYLCSSLQGILTYTARFDYIIIASFFFVNTQKHSHPTLQLFLISEDFGMSFPSFSTKWISKVQIWYLCKWNLYQVCMHSPILIRNTIMGLDAGFEVKPAHRDPALSLSQVFNSMWSSGFLLICCH